MNAGVMKQGIRNPPCCIMLLVLMLKVTLPVHCSIIHANALPKDAHLFKFDNQGDRDSRFHNLYMNINEMKDEELDKRLATAVRLDPFAIFHLFLSAYVLVNHAIEPIIPKAFQSRIRFQNLVTETSIHLIEIFLRLQIPTDLANQSYIFQDQDILQAARMDMIEIARTREGQQIAYSLICIFNGSPSGCILPLLIRNIPVFIKYVGIITLLCVPGFGGHEILVNFFNNLCDVPHNDNAGRNIDGAGRNIDDAEALEAKVNEKSSSKSEFVFKKIQKDDSIGNSRVIINLISESLSVVLETIILVHSVINLPKGKEGKIDPLIIFKHLVCTIFVFQYVSVRGKAFGKFLSNIFVGINTLDTVQNNMRLLITELTKFSPANILLSFSNPIRNNSADDNGQRLKKKKSRGKKVPKKS